jgi:porphobilinogen synthase
MAFPEHRPRRLRATEGIRRLVRENRVSIDDLVYPLFVCPGKGVRREISSMPGNFQMSPDLITKECGELTGLGIPGVILFGIPESKDEDASRAYAEDGVVQQAVRAIKECNRDLVVITDVCLCEYMSHGHCGVVEGDMVHNDRTLDLLARQALSHVQAGADIVAPSDMMDGRVQAIRRMLDENGFDAAPIMSYAAKYASAFYGPFREAAESAPRFGDRKNYQMDCANSDEALREVELDIQEGADIVMVKPALSYLDVLYRVKAEFNVPVAAYNVSGEFSCLHAGADRGWIDLEKTMMEVLCSIKRAGADIIITYFAKQAARLL